MIQSGDILLDTTSAVEILRLAAQARNRMDFFTCEDLIRAGAEIDVPAEDIISAQRLVRERQSESDDRAEYRRLQMLQALKWAAISIPMLTLLCVLHTFSFLQHALSALKGLAKGTGALCFAKSTGHEIDFQTWRNRRFFTAEYGGPEPKDILASYFKGKCFEHRSVLISWLADTALIELDEASKAVDEYAVEHPLMVRTDFAFRSDERESLPKKL
jgi:hypothetical protein